MAYGSTEGIRNSIYISLFFYYLTLNFKILRNLGQEGLGGSNNQRGSSKAPISYDHNCRRPICKKIPDERLPKFTCPDIYGLPIAQYLISSENRQVYSDTQNL